MSHILLVTSSPRGSEALSNRYASKHLRVEGVAHGPEAVKAAVASADEAVQSLLKQAADSVEAAQ
jgi:FMN-dependent NADH-azoreductase